MGSRRNRTIYHRITLLILMALVFVRPGGTLAASYNTITIDGQCTGWAADEQFDANNSDELWFSWDAGNIYVGWWGGGGPTDRRIIAFDLNAGADDIPTPLSYAGVTFPIAGEPDYLVEWNNNQVFLVTRTGSVLSNTNVTASVPNAFSASGTGCGGENFVELQLPRTLFTGGSVSGLTPADDLRITSFMVQNGTNTIYSGMPTDPFLGNATCSPGGTPGQAFNCGIDFDTTDSGRAPNSYGVFSFMVNSLSDTDDGNCNAAHCSLREAINAANFDFRSNTIYLTGLTGTITLTSALPTLILNNFRLIGPGPSALAISGNTAERILNISIIGTGTVQLNGLAFVNGAPGGAGGAIQNNDDTLIVENARFSDNTATTRGGAIASGLGSNLTIRNTTFLNNQTIAPNSRGGAISARGTLTVENSFFTSNSTLEVGGGIYSEGSTTILASVFAANQATAAPAGGGALFIQGSPTTPLLVRNSVFTANRVLGATSYAGAIGIQGAPGLIENSSLIENQGNLSGGIHATVGADVRVVNTLLARNSGAEGAALRVFGSTTVLQALHVTIAGAEGGSSGEAIGVTAGTAHITNTIVSSYTVGMSAITGTLTDDSNLFFGNTVDRQGITPGSQSVNGPPLFVAPSANNYRLRDGSWAANGGTNAGVTTDIDGLLRPQGSGFDIGCHEVPFLSPVLPVISSSANPSVVGQATTFTVTVNRAPGAGVPTGTATFFVDGLPAGTLPLSGGAASIVTSALSLGTHTITATYSGNANFLPATSEIFTQTVGQAGTGVALASSANPSVVGQSVAFTATVSVLAPGAGAPGGSVSFFADGIPIGVAPLSGGQASVATAALPVGTRSITASYSGDANFLPGTGTLTQTVARAATGVNLVSIPNPSLVGQNVAFTATVSVLPPGAGLPTGTISFFADGIPIGTTPLSGTQAALATSALPVGTRSITASYSGDANFLASVSPALNQLVTQASVTIELSRSLLISTYGQSVAFTATVSVAPPGAGTPTGIMSFFADTGLIGSAPLSGDSASLSTTLLPVGTRNITVSYSGDTNFSASVSNVFIQLVTPATLIVTPTDALKIYGAPLPPFTYTVSGFVNGENASVLSGAPDSTATISSNVGTYPIGLGTLAAANYTFTLTPGTLTVTQALLQIRADDQIRRINQPNPTFTASYSGFVLSDGPSVLDTLPSFSTTAVINSPPGLYPIEVFGAADLNYAPVFISGTLTITDQDVPLVTWNPPLPIVYGTVLGATQLNATASVTGSFSYTPPAGTVLRAGAAQPLQVVFTPGDLVNYAIVTRTVSLDVLPAPLIIGVQNATIITEDSLPSFTLIYTGFVNGDTSTDLDVAPSINTLATPASPPGNYPILLSGALDSDYAITLQSGQLTILARPIPTIFRSYLPLAQAPAAADLIVEQIDISGGQLRVTIANTGSGSVAIPFWVDVYLDPREPPTAANQVWGTRGERGLVWGVFDQIPAGGRITLTPGDKYFWPLQSRSGGPIVPGTVIYAQVDSYNPNSNLGWVVETHEELGEAYNNITRIVASASADLPAVATESSMPERSPQPHR